MQHGHGEACLGSGPLEHGDSAVGKVLRQVELPQQPPALFVAHLSLATEIPAEQMHKGNEATKALSPTQKAF